MSESFFGHPSLRVHPSHSNPTSANRPEMDNHPAPVSEFSQRPSFSTFQFSKIGKTPVLLNRISQSDSSHVEYRSPSPNSPDMLPSQLPHNTLRGNHPSRPTLYETLGSSDASQVSQQHSTHSAAYMQNVRSADDSLPPATAEQQTKRQGSMQRSDLIPPITFLPSDSDTHLSPSPAKLHCPQDPQSRRTSTSATSLSITTNADHLELTYPSPANETAASSPMGSALEIISHNSSRSQARCSPALSSILSQINTPLSQHPPSISNQAARAEDMEMAETENHISGVDPLTALQDQLQRSARALESLAPPPLSPRASSPVPVIPQMALPETSMRELDRMITGNVENVLRDPPEASIVLRNPYEPSSAHSYQPDISFDNPLAVATSASTNVPSQLAVSQALHVHSATLVRASHTLHSATAAVIKIHTEAENLVVAHNKAIEEEKCNLEAQRHALEGERKMQEDEFRKQAGEILRYHERLRAKEDELRLEEEKRKVIDNERRAKEEELRAQDELRRQQLIRELTTASAITEEIKAERERTRNRVLAESSKEPLRQPPSMEIHDEESMGEEEKILIKRRQDLYEAVDRLHRMRQQKLKSIEECDSTLQRLKEERLQVAAERERIRVEEEEERARAAAEELRRLEIVAEEERQKAAAEKEHQQRIAAEAELNRRKALEAQAEEARKQALQDQADLLAKQQAHAEAQAHAAQQTEFDAELQRHLREQHQRRQQERQQQEFLQRRAQVTAARDEAQAKNAARIRAERGGLFSRIEGVSSEHTSRDEISSIAEQALPLPSPDSSADILTTNARALDSPPLVHSPKRSKPLSGGIRLSVPQTGEPKSSATGMVQPHHATLPPPSPPDTASVSISKYNSAKAPSFVTAATDVGRQVATDTPLFSIALASEFNHCKGPSSPSSTLSQSQALPRKPKSQTILHVASTAGQELNIGPRASVSPAQTNANLRHLRRTRSRIEENGSGDRSVKSEDGDNEIAEPSGAAAEVVGGLNSAMDSCHRTEQDQIPAVDTAVSIGQKALNHANIFPSQSTSVIAPPRPVRRIEARTPPIPTRSDHVITTNDTNRSNAFQLGGQIRSPSPSPWLMDPSADSTWRNGSLDREPKPEPTDDGSLRSQSQTRALPSRRQSPEIAHHAVPSNDAPRHPSVQNSTGNVVLDPPYNTGFIKRPKPAPIPRQQVYHHSPPTPPTRLPLQTSPNFDTGEHWSPSQNDVGRISRRSPSPIATKKRRWEYDEAEEGRPARKGRNRYPPDHKSRASPPERHPRPTHPDPRQPASPQSGGSSDLTIPTYGSHRGFRKLSHEESGYRPSYETTSYPHAQERAIPDDDSEEPDNDYISIQESQTQEKEASLLKRMSDSRANHHTSSSNRGSRGRGRGRPSYRPSQLQLRMSDAPSSLQDRISK
ncbi:hypothetical protein BJ138DRAFT_624459 [Hygrophoropsis aurantiaca]|uniref:Uncharacterized protein n=1 Tax=Hygrophoropsis aurantiaca TaxID=72124 RepID=A0ACB8AL41_9AGAM|nr:hypothetical protein BJ138DRAFT_624459 [Hygrophoropsis aurantiaca]